MTCIVTGNTPNARKNGAPANCDVESCPSFIPTRHLISPSIAVRAGRASEQSHANLSPRLTLPRWGSGSFVGSLRGVRRNEDRGQCCVRRLETTQLQDVLPPPSLWTKIHLEDVHREKPIRIGRLVGDARRRKHARQAFRTSQDKAVRFSNF